MKDTETSDGVDIGKLFRNAGMATLLGLAKSDQAIQLEEELYHITLAVEEKRQPRKRKRSRKNALALRKTISAFAADLLYHSMNKDALGFCFRSQNRADFSETAASSRNFELVKEMWLAENLIEQAKGYVTLDKFEDGFVEGRAWATRYRATTKLISIASACEVQSLNIEDHYEEIKKPEKLVELRATKKGKGEGAGKSIKLDRTDQRVRFISDVVYEVNEALRGTRFNLSPHPKVRRIFNNGDQPSFDWDQGGRLYALGSNNFQQMSSEERRGILIDGEKNVEVDIKSSHLTLAYGLARIPLPEGDLYAIESLPREVVKGLVTAFLGKGCRPTRWPKTLSQDYMQYYGSSVASAFKLSESVDLVLEAHPFLGELESIGLNTYRLQFIESEIVIGSMLELLREHNVISLPIHDCLLVKEKDSQITKSILESKFFEIVGIRPTLTTK